MDSSQFDIRLSSIEQRLTRIENALILSSAQPATVTSKAPTKTNSSAVPPVAALYDSSALYAPKPGNWLGVLAIVCFVLAAGFIIKLSIDSGWLTPVRQIGIAVLFGLGLIGAGFILLEYDRGYASMLPGAGIIVLYITTFASHRYYTLISYEFALFLSAVVSAICIGLYTRIQHDIYPITAAIGAYLAPVILGLNTVATFSLCYFILCSLAFAVISTGMRSRSLTLISAYLAILMSALAGAEINRDGLIACALAANFLIFSVGVYIYTAYHNEPLSEAEAWSFFPVLLIFYAMEYHFIERVFPALAPWLSLGFAGVLISLYQFTKLQIPGSNLGSRSPLISFTTIVCFHSIYLELLPEDFRPWLFIMIVMGFAFVPLTAVASTSKAFYAPFFALFAILAIEYITMVFHLLSEHNFSWLVVSFASLGSLWFLLMRADNASPIQEKFGNLLLGMAHILAISALYRLTKDTGSLAISASWLLYAVCVMFYAFIRKDGVMAKSALIVLGFAAGKALLFDAASAATVVRILCLILTGVVLYGAGFLMRKISSWSA